MVNTKTSGTVDRVRWLCPVWGVAVGDADAALTLISTRSKEATATFRLVPITDEERQRLDNGAWSLPVSSVQIHSARAAIETDAPAIFGSEPLRETGLTICSLALAIWCDQISVPFCFLMRGGPGDHGGLTSTQQDPFVPSGVPVEQPLGPDARTQLPIAAAAIAASFDVLAGAALRFYWAGHKPFLLDATLDYAIAAESLLCRGVENGVSSAFRRRGSNLLARGGGDRATLEEHAKQIYGLRSKIAHGDDRGLRNALEPWQGDAVRACNDVRAFTRDILLAMLANPSLFSTVGLQQLD